MTTTVQPTIPITMGDPVGIGPESIVKVLADPGRENRAGRAASPR
jgi:4-hydroxy-L-threonine phosphate dehydrogenase PdxA